MKPAGTTCVDSRTSKNEEETRRKVTKMMMQMFEGLYLESLKSQTVTVSFKNWSSPGLVLGLELL